MKRGEQWACVTVTLASGDPARPLTVQRKVTCEAAAACSDYKLDGRPAKAKDVAKAVADMNIQLDNLCQARGMQCWAGARSTAAAPSRLPRSLSRPPSPRPRHPPR